MNGENPYAPPAVTETEAPTTRYWHTFGTSLIVRNGATLPKIDLETGAGDENLRPVQRIYQGSSAGGVMRLIILVAMYVVLSHFFEIHGVTIVIYFFAGSLILRQVSALRGNTAARVSIWSFTEERRAKRAKLRSWIRMGGLFLLISFLFLNPGDLDWILPGYLAWLCLVIALGVWALLDKPKFKIHPDKPGWMRITPLHPDALKKFHELEARLLPAETLTAPRKRLVRTIFYHRFPLRMLIGHRITNPLAIVQCALMKLLRSRLLVREAWHFSEAEETPLENLHPQLRDAATTWLATHPSWTFITGERLPSPAGDLVMESAVLAAPALDHIALVHRAWMEQRPEKGLTHFTFLTWLTDGTHASTHDQHFLNLDHPHLHQRAPGTPEQVWQAHLRHVSTLAVSPATDIADLRARLLREKTESDRRLTENGLQSETRESTGC